MMIRVYKNGALAFRLDDPAKLENFVPEEDIDNFTFDGGDMEAWRAAQKVKAVRAEAARRMMVLVGARDERHLDIIITNGAREAIRLLRKGQANWTPEEAQRAAALERMDRAIDAIRAASNRLEAMNPVPEDYADERWWG